ncbi:hypothetical protein LCGC14_0946700 [marine sediment metagenome]|uniref:Uncharacterized protein n=1 Tax=marine sediment metagenome TaxID=412755 RepID=A0A0F9NIL2_9ZZZZ
MVMAIVPSEGVLIMGHICINCFFGDMCDDYYESNCPKYIECKKCDTCEDRDTCDENL